MGCGASKQLAQEQTSRPATTPAGAGNATATASPEQRALASSPSGQGKGLKDKSVGAKKSPASPSTTTTAAAAASSSSSSAPVPAPAAAHAPAAKSEKPAAAPAEHHAAAASTKDLSVSQSNNKGLDAHDESHSASHQSSPHPPRHLDASTMAIKGVSEVKLKDSSSAIKSGPSTRASNAALSSTVPEEHQQQPLTTTAGAGMAMSSSAYFAHQNAMVEDTAGPSPFVPPRPAAAAPDHVTDKAASTAKLAASTNKLSETTNDALAAKSASQATLHKVKAGEPAAAAEVNPAAIPLPVSQSELVLNKSHHSIAGAAAPAADVEAKPAAAEKSQHDLAQPAHAASTDDFHPHTVPLKGGSADHLDKSNTLALAMQTGLPASRADLNKSMQSLRPSGSKQALAQSGSKTQLAQSSSHRSLSRAAVAENQPTQPQENGLLAQAMGTELPASTHELATSQSRHSLSGIAANTEGPPPAVMRKALSKAASRGSLLSPVIEAESAQNSPVVEAPANAVVEEAEETKSHHSIHAAASHHSVHDAPATEPAPAVDEHEHHLSSAINKELPASVYELRASHHSIRAASQHSVRDAPAAEPAEQAAPEQHDDEHMSSAINKELPASTYELRQSHHSIRAASQHSVRAPSRHSVNATDSAPAAAPENEEKAGADAHGDDHENHLATAVNKELPASVYELHQSHHSTAAAAAKDEPVSAETASAEAPAAEEPASEEPVRAASHHSLAAKSESRRSSRPSSAGKPAGNADAHGHDLHQVIHKELPASTYELHRSHHSVASVKAELVDAPAAAVATEENVPTAASNDHLHTAIRATLPESRFSLNASENHGHAAAEDAANALPADAVAEPAAVSGSVHHLATAIKTALPASHYDLAAEAAPAPGSGSKPSSRPASSSGNAAAAKPASRPASSGNGGTSSRPRSGGMARPVEIRNASRPTSTMSKKSLGKVAEDANAAPAAGSRTGSAAAAGSGSRRASRPASGM
ncbi:hypothetical protein H9P43_001501 [Blastocladiella emersonii ATCC 22665]|nr:hypothetical protein H9P43_001501 [Blastocladiella emersonii ATCC 22665]